MNKKGQITVFIIIGILILAAVGVYLYISGQQAKAPLEAEEMKVTEVATEVQPIKDFVTQCLYLTAKQGLEILGARGGYIIPTQRYNPYEPTEGSAVQFAPESEIKIPYWWHMSSKKECQANCDFTSEAPSIQNVEAQLNSYIKKELPNCLGTFENFRAQAFTVAPAGEIQPRLQFTKRNVIVALKYPLTAEKAGAKFELEEYATTLPVNFLEMFTLAANITNLEAEHAFLERATRSLIDIFGRADSDALPPVSEMEFGFGVGTFWTKFDVQDKIAQMLTSYIPMLKVPYTRNYQYIFAPEGKDRQFYEVLYNRGFTVPSLDNHKTLDVKFAYLPWWKPYMDLNCNGQLCQAEGFSNTWGFLFGVRRYSFAYDISYPVLVEIKNPDAYGGEGYSLRFFLEANMRNNEPLALMEPPLQPITLGEQSSMLCDPLQRTGGNITINVKTSAGKPVDSAEVMYKCGKETCQIGTSANGKLEAQMPRCLGGILSASHMDYAPAAKPIDAIDSTAKTAELVMSEPYTVDFAVKKWVVKKGCRTPTSGAVDCKHGDWELDTTQIVNQGRGENSIIMLEKKGAEFEDPVIVLGNVCGAPVAKANIPCGNPPSDLSKGIRIYSGDYSVKIYAFNYPAPQVNIPADRRCFRTGIGKRKCYNVPPQPIVFSTAKPYMSGMAEYDWSVTDEQLRAAKQIEFAYIGFGLDKVQPASNRIVEDLEVMGELASYSEPNIDLLMPKIT
jgi:hypothetical protein